MPGIPPANWLPGDMSRTGPDEYALMLLVLPAGLYLGAIARVRMFCKTQVGPAERYSLQLQEQFGLAECYFLQRSS